MFIEVTVNKDGQAEAAVDFEMVCALAKRAVIEQRENTSFLEYVKGWEAAASLEDILFRVTDAGVEHLVNQMKASGMNIQMEIFDNASVDPLMIYVMWPVVQISYWDPEGDQGGALSIYEERYRRDEFEDALISELFEGILKRYTEKAEQLGILCTVTIHFPVPAQN
jgi:hypothetical protein